MSLRRRSTPRTILRTVGIGLTAAVLVAGCSSKKASNRPASAASDDGGADQTVNIELTSAGCQPTPATVTAGHVAFNIATTTHGDHSTVPFYGDHQAGIATPSQDRLTFGVLNLGRGRKPLRGC